MKQQNTSVNKNQNSNYKNNNLVMVQQREKGGDRSPDFSH